MFGLLLVGAYVPLPVPYQLDFQVIYLANKSLLHGISLYDRAAQVQYLGLSKVLPFPYPPWYALVTLPLAWLRMDVAARLWLELNLVMLLLSVWLLTDGWKPRMRLVAFPMALMFIPVLGALYIGQYVFPVLLGSALLVFALQREAPPLTALAAALLTFKPHLGGLILLVLLIYLWLRRNAFARRALWMIVVTGVFLFAVGFLADSVWPLNYVHSITNYGQITGVQSCELCASLPIALAHWIGTQNIRSAFWIAGVLLVMLFLLFVLKRSLWKSPAGIVAGTTLVTLLASPYLLNYDFVLQLLPLLFLAGRIGERIDWLVLIFIYILPLPGLVLFGRQGNIVLVFSAVLLLVWLLLRENLLDSPPSNLYNQENSLREE